MYILKHSAAAGGWKRIGIFSPSSRMNLANWFSLFNTRCQAITEHEMFSNSRRERVFHLWEPTLKN